MGPLSVESFIQGSIAVGPAKMPWSSFICRKYTAQLQSKTVYTIHISTWYIYNMYVICSLMTRRSVNYTSNRVIDSFVKYNSPSFILILKCNVYASDRMMQHTKNLTDVWHIMFSIKLCNCKVGLTKVSMILILYI